MATGDLTTLEDVKTYLKGMSTGNDNASDEVLTLLIGAASQWIKSYCDMDFLEEEYDYLYSGMGQPTVILPNYPVTKVTSVLVNGFNIPLRGGPGGAGYSVNTRKGTVSLSGYVFEYGDNNVEIIYTAGYPTLAYLPLDLRFAATKLAVYRYKERSRLGKNSESLGGQQNVSYSSAAAPEDIINTLKNYKRGFSAC